MSTLYPTVAERYSCGGRSIAETLRAKGPYPAPKFTDLA